MDLIDMEIKNKDEIRNAYIYISSGPPLTLDAG